MTIRTQTTSVNPRRNAVNSRHSPTTQRLLPHVTQAARAEPTKVLALKTGISPREITDLREGRRMPSVPTFFELAKHDANLRAQVMAILSGEAEACSPDSIDALVRRYTRGG